MTEYFEPIRRRMGLVMLVLACLFTAGWVRSEWMEDSFEFRIGRYTALEFRSVAGKLRWILEDCSNVARAWQPQPWHSRSRNFDYYPKSTIWEWPIRACLVYEGNSADTVARSRHLHVTYWSVVIPLTLLSSWLLLSKMRQPELATPSIGPTE